MQVTELQRKQQLEQRRNHQEAKVAVTMDEKARLQVLSKEQNNLQRIDRQKTVERIMRKNEYQQEQIKRRIQQDDMRAQALKDQKVQLMEQRRAIQKKAIVQKS
jgi:hypothetical protein